MKLKFEKTLHQKIKLLFCEKIQTNMTTLNWNGKLDSKGKPKEIIKIVLPASSNEGDLVLDTTKIVGV
jgi:hypothetical protein